LISVLGLTDEHTDTAVDLLVRFFAEEGLSGTPSSITANARLLRHGPDHWIGLAWSDEIAVGIVTITTMLYVEWGRLGEIGDLYVIPSARRKCVATALIEAGKDKCCELGCSAVSVTITPGGEARHGLSDFYRRFGFVGSGRSILTCTFPKGRQTTRPPRHNKIK
jgi:GNAT superfamily N-acetyltransferase